MIIFGFLIVKRIKHLKGLKRDHSGCLLLNRKRNNKLNQIPAEKIQNRVTKMILVISAVFIINQLNNITIDLLYARKQMFGSNLELFYFFTHSLQIVLHFLNFFAYYFHDRYFAFEFRNFLKTNNIFKSTEFLKKF